MYRKIAVVGLAGISTFFAWLALTMGEVADSSIKSATTSVMDAALLSISFNGSFSSSLLFLLLLIPVYVGWDFFFKASARVKICTLISSAVLGFSLALSSRNLNPEVHRLVFDYQYIFLRYVGFVILLICCLGFFLCWCEKVLQVKSLSKSKSRIVIFSKLEPFYCSFNAKNVLIISSVVFLFWLPWIVMLFPANIGPDTVAQLVWMRTGKVWDPSTRLNLPGYALSDHHPWFDSLIYGAFDKFGFWIGNEEAGLFLLELFHAVFLAASFGVVLTYLPSRVGVPVELAAGLTLFVALVPVYGRLSMSVVKDLTFMPFYLLWLVMYIEYARRTIARCKIPVAFYCLFVSLSILCMLTRKIAFYILLFSLAALLIFIKRRVVTSFLMLALVLSQMLIPKIVFPVLHVAPSGVQEVIVVPLQQSAGMLIEHGDEINNAARKQMLAVYSCSVGQMKSNISLESADSIKDNCFNRKSSKTDLINFLKSWAQQALRYPMTCWRYTSWLLYPFYMNSNRIYDEGFFVHWGWEDRGGNGILRQYKSHEKSSNQKIGEKVYTTLERLPIINVLMTETTYVLWIPVISLGLCIVLKRWANLLISVPFLLSIGTLLVSPMAQLRYSWSLLFGAVILISLPFMKIHEE